MSICVGWIHECRIYVYSRLTMYRDSQGLVQLSRVLWPFFDLALVGHLVLNSYTWFLSPFLPATEPSPTLPCVLFPLFLSTHGTFHLSLRYLCQFHVPTSTVPVWEKNLPSHNEGAWLAEELGETVMYWHNTERGSDKMSMEKQMGFWGGQTESMGACKNYAVSPSVVNSQSSLGRWLSGWRCLLPSLTNPWSSHGGRRELPCQSCLPTSKDALAGMCTSMHEQ